MSLGLIILIERSHFNNSFYVQDELSFTPDYDLFTKIKKKLKPRSCDFDVIDLNSDNPMKSDTHGEELTYVTAWDFFKLTNYETTKYNEAIILFCKHLPPITRLVLFWT